MHSWLPPAPPRWQQGPATRAQCSDGSDSCTCAAPPAISSPALPSSSPARCSPISIVVSLIPVSTIQLKKEKEGACSSPFVDPPAAHTRRWPSCMAVRRLSAVLEPWKEVTRVLIVRGGAGRQKHFVIAQRKALTGQSVADAMSCAMLLLN